MNKGENRRWCPKDVEFKWKSMIMICVQTVEIVVLYLGQTHNIRKEITGCDVITMLFLFVYFKREFVSVCYLYFFLGNCDINYIQYIKH